jgi:hypothetical protein
MKPTSLFRSFGKYFIVVICCALVVTTFAQRAGAQTGPASDAKKLYDELKAFKLGGGTVQVENLVLQRDRVQMIFKSGTIYFAAPVAG